MKQKSLKVTAIFLGMIAAALSAAPLTASAAGAYGDAEIIGSLTTTFDKYLVMHESAVVPNVAFGFAITKGDAVKATDTTEKVFAGVGRPEFLQDDAVHTGSADAGIALFSNSDTTIAEDNTPASDTPVFSTVYDEEDADSDQSFASDEKYAKKMMTISFPKNTPFPEPGIYRYYITENASTATGIINDSVVYRTLDVYVEDATVGEAKQLAIAGCVLYQGKVTTGPKKKLPEGKKVDDVPNGLEASLPKSNGYSNTYVAKNLTFGKEVEGNQGAKDKYFKFTLTIGNAAGATMNVKVADMDVATTKTSATVYEAEAMDAANNADDVKTIDGHQIQIGDTGSVTKEFYLRDGQYVTIEGLPKGASYAIAEESEDYTSEKGTDKVAIAAQGIQGEAGYKEAKLYDDPVSGTIGDSNIYTGFTNTRQGAIPTGVFASVAEPALIAAIGLAGVAAGAIYIKKKKSEKES